MGRSSAPSSGGRYVSGDPVHDLGSTGVTNGWLLVFLYRMCCHRASCAVVRLVAFQGVQRKPCMLPLVGGNF